LYSELPFKRYDLCKIQTLAGIFREIEKLAGTFLTQIGSSLRS
jgi:hypothetical protein